MPAQLLAGLLGELGGLGGALGSLASTAGRLTEQFAKPGAATDRLMGTFATMGNAIGTVGSAFGVLGAVTEKLGTVMILPIKAMMAVKDGFDSLVGTVRPLVEAFAPTTVLVFDQAMRDVTAVLGTAFVPIMQGLTVIVRAFGEAMLPAMKALEPIIRETSDVMLRFLVPVMRNLGGMVQGGVDLLGRWWDVVKAGMPVWEGLFDLWRAFSAVFQGVIMQVASNLIAWVKFGYEVLGLKKLFGELGGGLKNFAMNLMLATARLAKAFGANDFIAQMKRSLGAGAVGGSTVGYAAVQNAQVREVPEWVRDLAAKASMASGQMGKSPEDDFRRESLAALEKLDQEEISLKILLRDLNKEIITAIKNMPKQAAEAATDEAVGRVGSHSSPLRGAEVIGRRLGRAFDQG